MKVLCGYFLTKFRKKVQRSQGIQKRNLAIEEEQDNGYKFNDNG